MMGKTHKYGGFATGVIASTYLVQEPYTVEKFILAGIVVGTSVLGSLLPDIDHVNSTIGQKHKITSKVVNVLFGHRGITHAPLFNFLIISLLFYLSTFLTDPIRPILVAGILGLLIGIVSHLVLDIITVSGIPLFYPFSKECISIGKLKSSKHNGIVCVLITVVMILILGWKLFL